MALSSKSQFGPYAAHACASWVLKSTTRWRTRARRSTSAWAVEAGLASSDWQMPNSDQVVRADDDPLPTFHSCQTFGTDRTATLAFGRPLRRVARAASMLDRNDAMDVMPASLPVQASL